ncbi:MAG TPA: hypothetical protein VEW93_01000 [Acidimicrobiales bacterium]|nr:hypothetical protein [Acidimicrobiales bacterium]
MDETARRARDGARRRATRDGDVHVTRHLATLADEQADPADRRHALGGLRQRSLLVLGFRAHRPAFTDALRVAAGAADEHLRAAALAALVDEGGAGPAAAAALSPARS